MQPLIPNPNPNPPLPNHLPLDPNAQYYASHYASYYPHHHHQFQNPNPDSYNPNPNNPHLPTVIDPSQSTHGPYYGVHLDNSAVIPPGVDPYSSLTSYPQPYSHGYPVQQSGGVSYPHYQTVSVESMAAVLYYADPNAGSIVQNCGWTEAGYPYETVVPLPPNGTTQYRPALPNSVPWSSRTIRPKGTWKRAQKTKVVQSAYCEVCKVCCDTKEVLDLHKMGKKHKKNLEKLIGTTVPVPVVSSGSANPVIGPPENPAKSKPVSGKKAAHSETKPVQSVWCEVCRISCDTNDVLELHKSGKKHKKNLDKLKEAHVPSYVPPPVALAGSENPIIGPKENLVKSGPAKRLKSKKKVAADSVENLETKRRKVLEGGAAAAGVKTCSICNVVCNSGTVFQHHIAGQKHIALATRLASGKINIPNAT